MNTKLLSVVTAATTFFSIVAMIGSANAASLSYTASTGYAKTDSDPVTLSVQKFDSNLGDLNSVEIDFITNLLGTANVTNTGTRAAKVNVTVSGETDLTLNNQSLFSLMPNAMFPDPKTGKSYYTIAPNTTTQFPGLTTTASQTATYTDSNFLQSFIGTDNLDFLFSSDATSYISGSGNMNSEIITQAKATVNVTYNYNQKPKKVPEPSATLGIGLIAGLGFLSQKKKSFSKGNGALGSRE